MNIKFSKRIQALAPSATLAVAEKARALREQGVDLVAFGAGEPDFDTVQHVKDAAVAALAAGDTKYPTPVAGKIPLRQAICQYFKDYCGLAYQPKQVCVSVGAKDALHLAFSTLLEAGDEAIIPAPYWVSYPEQVRLTGATPVIVPGSPARAGKIGARELKAALTPRTRVLVLNSPSNPSGAVYTRQELEELADVLRPTDVCVVSDEIYHRLLFAAEPCVSVAALPGMLERTITVNGFSKTYSMTGWRLGFAAGPEEVIAAMVRLEGQTTSGPASFIQTAAIAALNAPQDFVDRMRETYRGRAERMHRALVAMPGVRCDSPAGGLFCFPDVSGTFARLGVHDADGFAEAALERVHVVLVSGTAFGAPHHVRLTFATTEEQIDEGMRRLARLVS